MELRIKASEDGFEEINFISYMISVYKNPQLFFGNLGNIPKPEREAEIIILEDIMESFIG